MSDVFERVEAALLDSEFDPEFEILDAMAAVIKFAVLELELTPAQLRVLFEQAIQKDADG